MLIPALVIMLANAQTAEPPTRAGLAAWGYQQHHRDRLADMTLIMLFSLSPAQQVSENGIHA
jgi:hypothetical protein